jgi:prepilin-type processing-associated H-X9-DG protein
MLVGRKSSSGFTLIEALVIAGICLLLVLMLIPALNRKAQRAKFQTCAYNLKMLGLALKTWNPTSETYPMQVSRTNGGTLELVGGNGAFVHFLAMSNQLSTPKYLFCPSDVGSGRKPATTFDTVPRTGAVPLTNDSQISYFIGVDACDPNPQMFLSGDRHLMINGEVAQHGLHTLTTNDVVSWNPKQGHRGRGNVLIVDGSVQQIDSAGLNLQWRVSGVATNRLVIP